MTSATTHTIVGFFSSREQAETAVSELVREGFSRDQLSILAGGSHSAASLHDTPNVGPIPETGSTEDVGEKAAIGSMAGVILGLAALAIPGVGPIIAAGPLAMALTGAAAGAATGGLIGVFTNNGIPEDRAKRYSTAIGSGNVMVSVHASHDRVDHAADILHRCGALDIDEPAEHIENTSSDATINTRPLPASATKFDESTGVRAKQRARERHVDVYPGITGGGPNPTY
ncbi:MAG TPA: general stress protein [Bryobacteraceae bacterium]|nr:general stress protein [Bryobacteraceae bacterium]